jgi:hypothetical protein
MREGSHAKSHSPLRTGFAVGALASLLGFGAGPASAQFGYTLPKDDFVWNWGRGGEDAANRGFEDFDVRGGEQGFNCELTGKVGLSGRMSQNDIKALEDQLRARLDFIYAAATYMRELEQQHLIDWARLACDKYEAAPSTEEEKAEREAKAKEKMQREIDRRRERQHQ